mmetsp:Transcript_50295/g.60666  ORF Transcript_50295/g.60666 Transcript_50295/m.60666 type:complete len:170 (+) Transcript_50295:633-1142(+)
MQRKKQKIGATLGKTTGWIHRAKLAKGNVELLSGCRYDCFDDDGNLHVTVDDDDVRVLDVDNVIVCAGQEKNDSLFATLRTELTNRFSNDKENNNGGESAVYVIGGAQEAAELDAKRAINMGVRLAYAVEEYGHNNEEAVRDAYLNGGRVVEEEEVLVDLLMRLSGKKK